MQALRLWGWLYGLMLVLRQFASRFTTVMA